MAIIYMREREKAGEREREMVVSRSVSSSDSDMSLVAVAEQARVARFKLDSRAPYCWHGRLVPCDFLLLLQVVVFVPLLFRLLLLVLVLLLLRCCCLLLLYFVQLKYFWGKKPVSACRVIWQFSPNSDIMDEFPSLSLSSWRVFMIPKGDCFDFCCCR